MTFAMIDKDDPRLAELPIWQGAWPKAEDYVNDLFGMPVLSPGRLDFVVYETETIPSEDATKPWETKICLRSLRLVRSFRLIDGEGA